MNATIKNYFNDISVGMTAQYERQVTDEDVRAFARISGDYNPIHLDEAFAKDSIFGERITHGMLTASHISANLYIFPGPGWIYVNQSLQFRAPVKISDTVSTRVRVEKCIPGKNLVELSTECKVGDKVVLTGTATVKSPD